jgi:hypothetical protein
MKNIIVIPKGNFQKDSMIEFVKSCGGYWVNESGIDQGVIERHQSRIYITYCNDINQEYEPDEIRAISQHLGRIPNILIDIHISWSENSNQLALDFASQVVSKWGGLVDDGMEIFC